MLGDYDIENIEEVLVGGEEKAEAWRVDYRRPDGSLYQHYITKSALEWRIAEYELSTTEEGIDLILHEPFMGIALRDPELKQQMTVDNGMRKVVRRIGTTNYEDDVTLFNADTREQARTVHRERLRLTKKKVKVTSKKDSKGKDPVDVIRNTHRLTKDSIQQKNDLVTAHRQRKGLDKDRPSKVHMLAQTDPYTPPFDEAAVRRIEEQKADPEDHMWE